MTSERFELLVVAICQRLLGMSVQGFTAGRDGGRDASFNAEANCYPSDVQHWKGLCIIQAKHVQDPYRSFSDRDFDKILKDEIKRIKRLRKAGMEYYLLFSNRRLSGDKHAQIIDEISAKCDMPKENIGIVDIMQLQNYCCAYSDYIKNLDFYPVDNAPLEVSPDLLSSVVEALVKQCSQLEDVEPDGDFNRVSYLEKNALNAVSKSCEENLNRRYLKYYSPIFKFLSYPANASLKARYNQAVGELQMKYIAKYEEGGTFPMIMDWLATWLTKRDYVLRSNPELARALLFYMYFSCDVGRKS